MRRIVLVFIVAVLTGVGFGLGIIFGPIIHGIMLGVDEVGKFIDRNSD